MLTNRNVNDPPFFNVVIARLNMLVGDRSSSSPRRILAGLRRDLAEIKHNKYLMKADNPFKRLLRKDSLKYLASQ